MIPSPLPEMTGISSSSSKSCSLQMSARFMTTVDDSRSDDSRAWRHTSGVKPEIVRNDDGLKKPL
jgi:hypothetical protein